MRPVYVATHAPSNLHVMYGSATAELSLPPGVTPASFGPGKNITFNEWSPDAAALELQPGERITVVFFAYLTMEWEPVRGVHLWSCTCPSEHSSTPVVVSTQSLFLIIHLVPSVTLHIAPATLVFAT